MSNILCYVWHSDKLQNSGAGKNGANYQVYNIINKSPSLFCYGYEVASDASISIIFVYYIVLHVCAYLYICSALNIMPPYRINKRWFAVCTIPSRWQYQLEYKTIAHQYRVLLASFWFKNCRIPTWDRLLGRNSFVKFTFIMYLFKNKNFLKKSSIKFYILTEKTKYSFSL